MVAAAVTPLNFPLTNDSGYPAPGTQALRSALVAAKGELQ